jgi:hypothetical protein
VFSEPQSGRILIGIVAGFTASELAGRLQVGMPGRITLFGIRKWTPLVQAPGDFNLREYRTDELFAVVPQSVKSPVLGCNY